MAQPTYTVRIPRSLEDRLFPVSQAQGISLARLAKKHLVGFLALDPSTLSQAVFPIQHGGPGLHVVFGLNAIERKRLAMWSKHHKLPIGAPGKAMTAILFASSPCGRALLEAERVRLVERLRQIDDELAAS
ncbi:MAG: hypothetical protein WC809_07310 [Sinimarinibacterium sp.]|jgi:hypothetical protein